jgi:hypothetical protein
MVQFLKQNHYIFTILNPIAKIDCQLQIVKEALMLIISYHISIPKNLSFVMKLILLEMVPLMIRGNASN